MHILRNYGVLVSLDVHLVCIVCMYSVHARGAMQYEVALYGVRSVVIVSPLHKEEGSTTSHLWKNQVVH